MVIADNASTDGTREIAMHYATRDPRIEYLNRSTNIGPGGNFAGLAIGARTGYFVWAAADDTWTPNYLAECVRALESDPQIAFASGTFIAVDAHGNHLRPMPAFHRFESRFRTLRLASFAWSKEAQGKANIIHSVFRTDLIQSICAIPDIFEGWGADMGVVAAALDRGRYRQVPGAVLHKQVNSDADVRASRMIAERGYRAIQFGGRFPPSRFSEYRTALARGMTSHGDRILIAALLAARLVPAIMREALQKVRRLGRR